MHAGFGLERLVSKHRDRALLSGRTVEALGEGEEPEASGHGEGNGYVCLMSAVGTFETCRPLLTMSIVGGRPEVLSAWPNRRY